MTMRTNRRRLIQGGPQGPSGEENLPTGRPAGGIRGRRLIRRRAGEGPGVIRRSLTAIRKRAGVGLGMTTAKAETAGGEPDSGGGRPQLRFQRCATGRLWELHA